ncbi:tRNA (guanosine(46)-N7)-methyltransferase TrmB [Lacticaseibacillus thailandensis]|uniref:tRNA (guanine-N(7)-)-methyltransferase n=1 Tax=Lacticaseibacillus thailandensis DSM 22698 = JCM 13996 TaxID=1423810 RepID=A0A0R2C9E0_9LACO|nr:tRNA (guanosine(46)-N7)-methyltransferase TrmB [Lacticaseibacillus thailandensis]KRM87973.1 S-adenosylmethionine-dependent methyltransferase [Lacticaseibacillus thailandensis DSM 22698 = JCM 13996]
MRLRNKKWAKPLIAAHPEMISIKPNGQQGTWQRHFATAQPLYLEVGSGKGQFIVNMAQKYPERNFIALEIQEVAVAYILRKQVALQLPNLHLILGDGADLTEYFAGAEVSGVYLNFSDPWPKKRNTKRRLTYQHFLSQYERIMAPAGKLQFKTDNQGLFEYSLVSMNNYGMQFDLVSLDLHSDPVANADNVETEYEQRFSADGGRIYELIAHYPGADKVNE